ncbi:hypothetical protein CDQ86_10120 [Staphylococcus aureus]|uniref:Uncharacterized protein n=1 Tax=Staphylococcus aureus TaxID=1280 RepID=Q93I95_STAAU|nr:hypothetical protein B4W80_10120 [Enterococcus faecium]AYQ24631.1 hypothetical protein AUF16_08690 [Enterococcus avium]EFT84367.1 hypothetical protein CGSSa03_12660 [Staphylococcus aureus subsp. aureus CGS03]KXA40506.1 hypothetical protein HMPREF3211_00147 [Staphylococcus aureus]OSO95819.1 hypothetical protein B9L24_05955 [Staphylococcus haemolyticus]
MLFRSNKILRVFRVFLVHYNLLLTGYNELTLSVHYNQLILIWLITNFINNKYRKSTHTFISFPFFSL